MRSQEEMFRLILETAQADERIRAAFLNGSRANPKVEPDRYRDYDVVFAVTEIDSFRTDPAWPSRFGEPAIIQEPMCNRMDGGEPEDCSRKFIWLMLFRDGVRLDLQIQRLDLVRETYGQDSLTVPLLDKDGFLPPLPPSDDSGYYVKKPTFTQYAGCTNEFWWCLNNVAKGIVRDQLPYVKWMFDSVVREALDHMVDWYIGVRTGFSVSVGMAGKYYKKYLPPALYAQYAATYADGEYTHIWAAVDSACDLFGALARGVGESLGFSYREEEETAIRAYLRVMKEEFKAAQG